MALASSAPGIFWANSGVAPQYRDVLPYPTYVKWYETVHIPDWMGAKEGAITTAWRYQCLDVNRPLPFLVTYKYPDLSASSSPEFGKVTTNSPLLPGGGPASKFNQIQVLSGPHIETWKAGSAGDERGPLMVSEAIAPAAGTTEAQFHEWYRTVYINEVSQLEGWRRTSRFENRMGQPRWFTIHEFEEYAFYDTNKSAPLTSLLGTSDKTKEVQKSATKLDLAFWNLTRVYGDGTVPWGRLGEDVIL